MNYKEEKIKEWKKKFFNIKSNKKHILDKTENDQLMFISKIIDELEAKHKEEIKEKILESLPKERQDIFKNSMNRDYCSKTNRGYNKCLQEVKEKINEI